MSTREHSSQLDAQARERIASLCRVRLRDLVASSSRMSGALICSGDGFELAAHLNSSLSAATLSAMASSTLALSEAVCGEVGVSPCRNVVMEGDTGLILMMDVPNALGKFVLAVVCQPDAVLGQVLFAARDAAGKAGRDIDAESRREVEAT